MAKRLRVKTFKYGPDSAWRLGIQVERAYWSMYRTGWLITLAFGRRILRAHWRNHEPALRRLIAAEGDPSLPDSGASS